ncbi:MAG: NAD(P)H-hydrate dehydratase [Anaerolineales bacterium]
MKIVNVKQMQAIEKSANEAGLSYQKMMDNAGRGIAGWVMKHISTHRGVIGLIGSGNNGGDTLIALSTLALAGIRTIGFIVKQRAADPLMDSYRQLGGALINISEGRYLDVLNAALIPGVVILDGILGTGIRLPVRGKLQEVMGAISELLKNCPDTRKIAVDCPSAVDCDTGDVSEVSFPANETLCMAAIKQGLLKQPARSYAGNLHLIDIGIAKVSEYVSESLPEMIDADYAASYLPQRPDTGHKGTFGTCLIIAGTVPFTGAAYLTGKAAYRAGCGLVNIATIKQVHHCLSGRLIEAVWTILPESNGGYLPEGAKALVESLKKADALILGPGWGLHDENELFLSHLLAEIPPDLPTLIDADGLKLLSRLDYWWNCLPKKTILTPHPGEMAILTGLTIEDIQSNRWDITRKFAKQWRVSLILKGAVTVIGTADSDLFLNPVSDAALATAGSGDVLSGVIGGLLAQGLSAENAAILGTWLHSQAGIIAQNTMNTDRSVTAIDILQSVEKAFVKIKEAV